MKNQRIDGYNPDYSKATPLNDSTRRLCYTIGTPYFQGFVVDHFAFLLSA